MEEQSSLSNFLNLLQELQKYDHVSGSNGYVEYYLGSENSNILLTVGHGGGILPNDMPTRRKPKNEGPKSSERVCVMKDAYTLELTFFIWKELTNLLNCHPHLVIFHLHRRKVDVNRCIEIGTSNHPASKVAWNEYHNFISDAKQRILAAHKRGILFDIHGHGHKEPFVELGYGVLPNDLISAAHFDSSIASLSKHKKSNTKELIVGEESLGAMFEARDCPAVPSPCHPDPTKYKYYTGGYTVIKWGSLEDNGELDAIQIEFPKFLREGYMKEAGRLSGVLHDFIKCHYQ